jgi:hypothetical protein
VKVPHQKHFFEISQSHNARIDFALQAATHDFQNFSVFWLRSFVGNHIPAFLPQSSGWDNCLGYFGWDICLGY